MRGVPVVVDRRPVRETRELAAKVRADNPDLTQAEVARQFGISAT